MSYQMPKEFGDYVLEFFGCLLPGFIFCTIHFVIAYVLLSIIYTNKIDCEFFNTIIGSCQFYAPIFIFSVSYVVGHMFYRKDPKVPDTRSYKKIMRRREFEPTKEREKWVEYNEKPSSVDLIEYPYNNLKVYYEKRGLEHISNAFSKVMIPDYRSKNWINVIKCRLRFAYPEKIRIIVKNEGHIRLMSSAWYGMQYTLYLGCFYFAFLVLITVFKLTFKENWLQDLILVNSLSFAIILVLSSILLSVVGRTVICSYLHYMRVREITNILETAYAAKILSGEKENTLFDDLREGRNPEIHGIDANER